MFALFTCAAILPAALLGAFQIRAWNESENARAERETLLASTSLAREVGRFLDARAEAVRGLALELGARGDVSTATVERATAEFVSVFSGFYGAKMTDLDGTTLGAFPVEPSPAHGVYRERDYFKRILAGADFAASDLLRSKTYGRLAVILAARVRDRKGHTLGVVIAGVDVAMVAHAVEHVTRAAPGLAAVVLDGSSTAVATSGDAPWANFSGFGQLGLFRAPDGDAPERRRGLDVDGSPCLGVSVRIPSQIVSWSAFSRWPARLVQERARHALSASGVVALGGLALALFLALVSARLVATPLARLSALVEGIAGGELRLRPLTPRPWYPEEFVRFSQSIDSTLSWLHSLLREIVETTIALSQVTQRLSGDSADLLRESQGQEQAVRHGSGAIVQMTDSMANVSASTRDISRAASETSASLTSLDNQIFQIAEHLATLTRTIEHASSEVEQMGRQVSATADSTHELSDNVSRTTGSIEAFGSSIEQVAEGAAGGEKRAQEAIEAAEAGRQAVQETIGATREIQLSFSAVDVAVQGLAGRSEAIGQVVRVIEGVTRDTELLSINASIIAAQAGEHGKSFAIVAGRVKELALETAASTREITNLVQAVQADIQEAVQAVERGQQTVLQGARRSTEAGRRLDIIIQSSGQAEQKVREIAQATRHQASGLRGVRQALAEVNRATSHIEDATLAQRHAQEQLASAIEQVRRVGDEVRRSIEAQTAASHAIAETVRSMTARLTAIASASATQSGDRARIAQSLDTFEGALRSSVGRARQVDEVVAMLHARLEKLERQLRSFQF